MASSIFDDKSIKPDADSLNEMLGTTGKLWIELKKYLEEKYGPMIEEWKYYPVAQNNIISRLLSKLDNRAPLASGRNLQMSPDCSSMG